MFSPRQPLSIPNHRLNFLRVHSSADRYCRRSLPRPGRGSSTFSSLPCFTLSLFCKKNEKVTPLFSDSSALFKKECFDNSFSINSFRTLLQNTGGGTPPPKIFSLFFCILATAHSSFSANSHKIRTYAKRARNLFTIRTSKTQHLKPFRICTYEKTPGGPQRVLFPLRPKQIRNIQVLPLPAFPFGNALLGNGGATRVKTLGR
jgi:hypothetical protein